MSQTEHRSRDVVRERLPSRVLHFLGRLRRSILLMIAASGVVLMLFSASVLSGIGWETVAGLLTISGFNITVIGLGGYLIYQTLDRRY